MQPGTWDTNYKAPTTSKPEPFEQAIDAPFEEVWDHLIHGLAKSFFVINNVEKASRIINVSFSSSDPNQYVDCGKTTQEWWIGENPPTRTTYATASDAAYEVRHWYPSPQNARVRLPATVKVGRNTSLEGRINIYVAPTQVGTEVSVTANYIVTLDVTQQTQLHDILGNLVRADSDTGSFKIQFTSTQVGTTKSSTPSGGSHTVECVSKGTLERELLGRAWTISEMP